jgi:hypothetical protein
MLQINRKSGKHHHSTIQHVEVQLIQHEAAVPTRGELNNALD